MDFTLPFWSWAKPCWQVWQFAVSSAHFEHPIWHTAIIFPTRPPAEVKRSLSTCRLIGCVDPASIASASATLSIQSVTCRPRVTDQRNHALARSWYSLITRCIAKDKVGRLDRGIHWHRPHGRTCASETWRNCIFRKWNRQQIRVGNKRTIEYLQEREIASIERARS